MARKNPGTLTLATGGVVAAGGFVALRLYMREETRKTLKDEYNYGDIVKVARTMAKLGVDVKLPTAKEFADAMVPLFGTNHPKTAFEDILKNGRKSEYWPAAYKTGAASAATIWPLHRRGKPGPGSASTAARIASVRAGSAVARHVP
jgi:hypothetical protein